MNAVTLISPAVARLDLAQAARTKDIGRTVNTGGYIFDRTRNGLKLSYPHSSGWNAMEIIPVGSGRYALVNNGAWVGQVSGRHLLSALTDYRRSAWMALAEWREREARYS